MTQPEMWERQNLGNYVYVPECPICFALTLHPRGHYLWHVQKGDIVLDD